jgi:hypothetical protein
MATDNCIEVFTSQTDTGDTPCTPIDASCVFIKGSYPFLKLGADAPLSEYIAKFEEITKSLTITVGALNSRIKILEDL